MGVGFITSMLGLGSSLELFGCDLELLTDTFAGIREGAILCEDDVEKH